MLHYAIVFFVIALIAAFLGFGALAGTAAWIAKVCLIVFLILAVLIWRFWHKKATPLALNYHAPC